MASRGPRLGGQGMREWYIWAYWNQCQWNREGCLSVGQWMCDGLIAGSVVMRRYYCIGSLDLGRQTGDGVARAAFW